MSDSPYEVSINVNGKEVSINAFVHNFYAHSLLGSLQALRDIPPNVESVTIQIKKK